MDKLRSVGRPLLSGVIILAIMLVFMKFISIDFRLVLLLSSTLFFFSGYFSAKIKLHALLMLFLITVPFTIVFDILIYKQIAGLLWFSVFFILSAFSGISMGRSRTLRNTLPVMILFPAVIIMAFGLVPKMLEEELSESMHTAVDTFTIYDMEENPITSEELIGNIIVLDFFGTWCKPCRLELKELEKIYQHYSGSDDVVFFVINTNEGGDNLEKMNAFIASNSYSFKFGFDYAGQLRKHFDLHGVPYLFIFDKEGILRYEHVGYNKGEANFVDGIIKIIDSLR